jgi:peptidyl-prolyl isomerase D
LAASKLGGIQNANTAKDVANRVLDEASLSEADRGGIFILLVPKLNTDGRAGKALYRKALAHVILKEEEEAEADLIEANKIVKDDKAILAELERVRQVRQAVKAKQKAQFKKMFS